MPQRKVKKSSSWKQARTAKKLLRKIKFLMFGVLCFLIGGAGIWVVSTLNIVKATPVSASLSASVATSAWNEGDPLNVLVKGSGKLGLIRVTPDLTSYVYLNLDNLYKDEIGVEKAVNYVETSLAIKVDRYIFMPSSDVNILTTAWGSYYTGETPAFGNYATLLFGLKDNLTTFLLAQIQISRQQSFWLLPLFLS